EVVLGRVAQPTQAVGLSDRFAKSPLAPLFQRGEDYCPCGCGGRVHSFSAQFKTGIKEQDTLDEMVDEALAEPDFNRQLDAMVKKAVAVVMACSSYDEAAEKLAEAYPNLTSKEQERYLANALFLADLLGAVNAEG
ncbi:DUF935 family protein, partial [Glaesserella parasuis]|uniref:phage portal protein family protein n=1 Tax=Glaesserella parasuis TaxID=738 RepID=UPI003854DE30